MDKMILANETELTIREGASTGEITVIVDDFAALGTAAELLQVAGNLDKFQFVQGEIVTGMYENAKLCAPLFRSVDVIGGKVHATFALREKTEMELLIEELRAEQAMQNDALAELGDVVGALAEGGAL